MLLSHLFLDAFFLYFKMNKKKEKQTQLKIFLLINIHLKGKYMRKKKRGEK
jgi:hypothetical protein